MGLQFALLTITRARSMVQEVLTHGFGAKHGLGAHRARV